MYSIYKPVTNNGQLNGPFIYMLTINNRHIAKRQRHHSIPSHTKVILVKVSYNSIKGTFNLNHLGPINHIMSIIMESLLEPNPFVGWS